MGTALETLLHYFGRIILPGLLALGLAGLAHGEEPSQVFHVGITSFRDKSVTLREWSPTMDYLAGKIPGSRFVAVPMNLHEFEAAVSRHEIDFVITNPEHYILLETVHGVSRVATLVKRDNGVLVNQFGGVIFTRADRDDIRDLGDVKGKRIASVDRSSFAAFLLQYDLLKEHDVDVDRDCHVDFLGFPQDLSVRAVLDGRADVGFVRSSVLEAMAREGKIDLAQVRILHPSHAGGFPFLISTGLFPEWPFAAAPQVPIDIRNQVAAALLTMPPDAPAARSARYYRWSTPVEYLSVQNLMRRHHIYPYDKVDSIALKDLVQRYAAQVLIATLSVLLLMATLYLRARRLNKALIQSRQQLDHLAHYDALTGLPNRNLLDYDLERAIIHARRTGEEFAVCLLDLDGFKPINDTWGHKVGDDVLREVAQHMQAVLRGEDTVARWGGDEFVLLLKSVANPQHLAEIVERILRAVDAPLRCTADARVRASIGVCLYPQHATSAKELLKHADEAMYRAKQAGGNRFVIHGR